MKNSNLSGYQLTAADVCVRSLVATALALPLFAGCGVPNGGQAITPTASQQRAAFVEARHNSGNFKTIYNFRGGSADGSGSVGGLFAIGDKLYGTTQYAGANGYGMVFELTMHGKERILHTSATFPMPNTRMGHRLAATACSTA